MHRLTIKNFDSIVSKNTNSIWSKTLSACDYIEIYYQYRGSIISLCSVNFIEETDYKNKYSPKILWQKETFYNEVFEHGRKMWGSALAWILILSLNPQNLINVNNKDLLSFLSKQRHNVKYYYTIQIPRSNLADERIVIFIRMLLEMLNNKLKNGVVDYVNLRIV